MAYRCINNQAKECDGCGLCQDWREKDREDREEAEFWRFQAAQEARAYREINTPRYWDGGKF